MAAEQEMSIVTELIKEVESYLPDMSGFLGALAEDSSSHNDNNVKELHRMTHTIKGAAAMVQLDELSKTAALMEDVLDDILAGEQVWNRQLIQTMAVTVDHIGAYCASLHKGEAEGGELHQTTRDAFETLSNSFSADSVVNDDSIPEEDALFALLGGDADDESTDDFFQQLSDEEEGTGSGDELAILLGSADSDSEGAELDLFLGMESNDSEEFDLDAATEKSLPAVVATIDPELQACFNEEVVQHLEEERMASGEDLDIFLGTADSDSKETALDAAPEDALPSPSPGIDPELQESFDEEAEEHLDNIGRQLNELSSSISEQAAVSDEYRERLHSIRRSVHTLKGAAAVIGIEPVADWGHDFEDFLDSLHDESDTISPESIAAMQDGADILEKIALNPAVDVSAEISTLQDKFPSIMAESSPGEKSVPEESSSQPAEEAETVELVADPREEQAFHGEVRKEAVTEQSVPIRITGSKNRRKQTRKKTLRVGSEKIAEIMGLGGDMAINLSSFENSTSSMQSGLTELEITLQRLQGIASSLEAGYELASIPHLGAGEGEYGITDEFDPLELDRYSELHILIRSLNEAVVDLHSIREQTFEAQDSWRRAIDRQRRIVGDVQGAVQSIQMTPFSTLANRLYKTVRESARVTGKKVRLLIEGGSMEMDTHIWDVLADALMHMLRNCVDHGVEPADERQWADKPEQATIRINCSRRGSRFLLRLSDDGGGLDHDAIRNRALTLYPETGVEEMDNNELAALIFNQGFSIRSNVTSISGRGVGMDVVRDALDQLDGFIEVHSTLGQGTEFVLSMPIVVAQLPALIAMFGRQQFAVPMRDVTRVLRLSDQERKRATFELNDEPLPLLRPVELLRLKGPAASADSRSGLQDTSIALVVETGGRRGVVVVDAVIGQRNVVFKSLGSHLQNIPCIAGATILGDGSLVPILQTEDLFGRVETAVQLSEAHTTVRNDEEKALEILIADDSISIRKVLSNFITAQGWHPTAAHDGVDAMEKIRDSKPDVIILDIEMPRMNGFEVLQTLQAQAAYRDIPVLMLTSRSAGKYREKAAGLGASGFVTKPFQDDELVSLINGLTVQTMAKGVGL
jgi:chemosensory pili system protein ChpA (sensor histidine kinase/response regulator)